MKKLIIFFVIVAAVTGYAAVSSQRNYNHKNNILNAEFDNLYVKLQSLRVDVGYHDRGDPSAYDFTQATLITDATWRDMDLSSIVPSDAKTVLLNVSITDDAVSSWLTFRKNGNTNNINNGIIFTQVANVQIVQDVIVACDTSQIIEYIGANLAFTSIDISVKGWWK